ncbi:MULTISPECIES: hypothetical protein [unclassified Pseudomonas]|uniref:hypothetical protein n=1 Tax=unclassified Pseudomonas TaxID=196821 RepID=UPI0025D8E9A1|nr:MULTISPECIES: hypothetical protein [unclassified Pseudomonas]
MDLIARFADNNDKIEVSALGYTGYGDGSGNTLKMLYNQDLDRIYLKDVEADAQGYRFEIGLTGAWLQAPGNADMIFASKTQVSLVEVVSTSYTRQKCHSWQLLLGDCRRAGRGTQGAVPLLLAAVIQGSSLLGLQRSLEH